MLLPNFLIRYCSSNVDHYDPHYDHHMITWMFHITRKYLSSPADFLLLISHSTLSHRCDLIIHAYSSIVAVLFSFLFMDLAENKPLNRIVLSRCKKQFYLFSVAIYHEPGNHQFCPPFLQLIFLTLKDELKPGRMSHNELVTAFEITYITLLILHSLEGKYPIQGGLLLASFYFLTINKETSLPILLLEFRRYSLRTLQS